VFRNLRDLSKYGGKCGKCEFIKVCGGCRARAYEATGDYLAEEPLCLYQPKGFSDK
jgi:radical SAM protein with 4Fe4S-binding SPASM domain